MPSNLIINPGAETGNTNGWTGSTGSDTNGWVVTTGTPVHSGSWRFGTRCASNCNALSQVIPLITGTLYQFSAWISYPVNTGFTFRASINNSTLFSLSSLTAANTYEVHATTFIANNSSMNLRLAGTVSSTSKILRLDDISLIAISFPTSQPSSVPSGQPTDQPSADPSSQPSSQPSILPTNIPSTQPTSQPSSVPTEVPSVQPSALPTNEPTNMPSDRPSSEPTSQPIAEPSSQPSVQPTKQPVSTPSGQPSSVPTTQPSAQPSGLPTKEPTNAPIGRPSSEPTSQPIAEPSSQPSVQPTKQPVSAPSSQPTSQPTEQPSAGPTNEPIKTSAKPSIIPTYKPSFASTIAPSFNPLNPTLSIDSTSPNFKISISMLGSSSQALPALSDIVVKEADLGNAYVVYGSKSNVADLDLSNQDNSKFFPIAKTLASDQTTRSLANIGDFNQDGFDDVMLGDPFNAKAYVFYARNNSFIDMNLGFTISGEQYYDFFGWSISKAGDFNKDGYIDLIGSALNTGKTYVIFGTGAGSNDLNLANPSNQFITISSINNGLAGLAVEGIGDINDDGYDDVAITALASGKSFVYVIFGKSQPQNINLASLNYNQAVVITAPTLTSLSLSNLGDINGDKIDDFIIGTAPLNGNVQTSFVLYGNKNITNLNLNNLKTNQGFKISGAGFFVNKIGDINNDGLNDIIVTNFQNWRGNINSYIFTHPDNITPAPTIEPSFYPSSLPSLRPSISSLDPSEIPTIFVTHPSAEPSFAPSGPSINPSFAPSKTTKPSLHPSIVKTNSPSIAQTALVTVTPSLKPFFKPSHLPTINNKEPSSAPSVMPNFSLDDHYTTVFISTGGVHKAQDSKTFFIINSTSNVEIIAGKAPYIYKIVPTANVKITISDFKINEDIISLTLFAGLNSINNINYQAPPLTLELPNTQQVIIISAKDFSLTENNFIFSNIKTEQDVKLFDQSLVSSLSMFFGLSFLAVFCYHIENIVDYFDKALGYKKEQPKDSINDFDLEQGSSEKSESADNNKPETSKQSDEKKWQSGSSSSNDKSYFPFESPSLQAPSMLSSSSTSGSSLDEYIEEYVKNDPTFAYITDLLGESEEESMDDV